ncbi:aspartokinase domain-containing protein [Pyrolobus fumarii 1A]|uniref:Aspartokinase domain-containing protein n=1 Tax=Pyrolobus fumarii (strain DSM 11204 / 1A) TaxID=694429 RepID=G0EDD5_PYRF1|nr:ACT domain-containing protein [Pyrolobus fumarii]AEM38620.1 aspartokinase domain-containing protein [Pyrolobus fumarii 1A]
MASDGVEGLLQVIDPCVARCVLQGVVNYSAAARLVASIAGRMGVRVPSDSAVKMRLIRWRNSSSDICYGLTCEQLLRVLAGTRAELREGVVVFTIPKSAFTRIEPLISRLLVEARLFHVLQGVASFTIIVDEEHAGDIRGAASEILEELSGQTAIVLVSPPEILTTPGFIAYIATLLAVNGVNITQVVSCYTDTLLILPSHVAPQAYQLIHRAIEVARKLAEENKAV